MKFAVGITLYQPTEEQVEYIYGLIEIFDEVFVFDNSKKSFFNKNENEQIYYNFVGENRGLSKAFNTFLNMANEKKCDYLLILDQDSMYEMKNLRMLMNQIAITPIDEKVVVRSGNLIPAGISYDDKNDNVIKKVSKVISSGSFINMHAINKYHLYYDENLFIDYVDDDFCKRVCSIGLELLCYDDYTMTQQLGYFYKGRICHSPVRHYYMVRDLGYFNIKYYGKFITELKTIKFLLFDMITCFREDNCLKKIYYLLIGYIDYRKKIHGECNIRRK